MNDGTTLADATALITGGAAGIGRAICERFVAAGANVVVADSNGDLAQATAAGLGPRAVARTVDVRRADEVSSSVDAAVDTFGGLDILVANAGVTSFRSVAELSEDEWDRVLDVNLKGTFLVTQAALPALIARGGGRIVTFSSILGAYGAARSAHYCASKWGVIGFSKSLAEEVGKDNITVNVVSPGVVETPMQAKIRTEMAAALPDVESASDVGAWMASLSPLRRTQEPEDVADLVAYLCGPGGRNLTGGVYPVDGGIIPRG